MRGARTGAAASLLPPGSETARTQSVIDMLEQEKTFFPPLYILMGQAEREAENERK